MGIRGPVRKSAEQREREGSPAHRPLPPSSAGRQYFGLPEQPAGMTAASRKVWDAYLEQMALLGTLRPVDGFALARLCHDVAELARLQRDKRHLVRSIKQDAEKEGKALPGGPLMELETSTAGRRLQATMNTVASRIKRDEDRFGLTPLAGTRLEGSAVIPLAPGVPLNRSGYSAMDDSLETRIQ